MDMANAKLINRSFIVSSSVPDAAPELCAERKRTGPVQAAWQPFADNPSDPLHERRSGASVNHSWIWKRRIFYAGTFELSESTRGVDEG
jgi:hypothetical protein